ncbi:hypothetical protein AcW2_007171 [Taiwanofungus camphoratus]|nr:hypothetical protein AcW2_007171 [Antrodia cinnamomea]
MLDELIRRTGFGINVSVNQESGDGPPESVRQKNTKVYLGLNVHGKKRKDLATKGDPKALSAINTNTIPILRKAAREGALGVVK